MTYAVVTPARDEQANLPRLAAALAAQTLTPSAWVIVDDGSTDGTPALLERLAHEHAWVRPTTAPLGDGSLARGRRDGRALDGFRAGLAELSEPVDVVIKFDADVDFDADYCERLVARFAAEPKLGLASGTCYERDGAGRWERRTKADSTVWGASRAYRWDCLSEVLALEPQMGWDGLDELRVQLRGLRTETFVDLPFRHHRTEGGREHSPLHHGAALGRASWYMGYRPSYLLLRALYRGVRQPTALAMLWGYAAAAATRAPRCADRDVVRALRDRQRLRAALRRGVPAS